MQASTRANEVHKIRTKWEGNGDRKPHPNRDGFASPTGVIAAATRCLRHGARRALHLRARQRLQRTHRGRGAVIGLALRPGLALPPPFSGDPIFGCAFSGATLERVARLDRGVWSRPHPTYRRAAPEPVPHPGKDKVDMCAASERRCIGRCATRGEHRVGSSVVAALTRRCSCNSLRRTALRSAVARSSARRHAGAR